MDGVDLRLFVPLILFALWAMALVLVLFVARVVAVASGKRKVASFKPYGDGDQLDAISRAHMNTLENLPVFTVTLTAAVFAHTAAPVAVLGWVVIGARIAQSSIHMISRAPSAVRLRALMMGVQAVCFIWMGVGAVAAIAGY